MEKSARIAKALIYLLASHIGGKAEPLAPGVLAEEVFSLAKVHGLGAICASALDKIGASFEKSKEYKARSIRKIMLMDAERAAICSALSTEGISHIPLKGVLIKELYPSIGDREMSDNDILIDPTRREEVRSIFLSRGYEIKSFGGAHDDVYMKAPVYNFEMHVNLFTENESPEFSKYFSDAFEKSIRENGGARRLSPEDFYLYITAHEYKHFSRGGTGLRSLLDAYLFLDANPELDTEKVRAGLSALGIEEYERARTSLAKKLFCAESARALALGELSLSEKEEKMLSYIIGSGVYGTEKNRVENEVGRASDGGSRARYVFRRLFPPAEWYKDNAPFVYKHRVLVPFYLIKRAFVKIILSPRKIIRELKLVKGTKGKENGVSR